MNITTETSLGTVVWRSWDEAVRECGAFLRQQDSNPFLNSGWMGAYWLATQKKGEQLLIAAVFAGSTLIAAAAFRYRAVAGVCSVRFLTEGRADFNGIAGEQTPEVFHAIWNALRAELPAGAVRFTDVRAGSPLAQYLGQRGPAVTTSLYPCPYRDLSPGAAADSSSNRKFQSRIPGYARRLEALGRIEFKVLDFDAERTASLAALPALFALHDLRHAGRRNSWKDDSNRAFLRSYLETAERTNFLAFVTELDGHPVAFDLGFRAGRRFVLYIPAFHPSFEKFRLGHINRHFSFQACKKMGIDLYDFSRGDSFAKRVWANGVEENLELCLPLREGPVNLAAAKLLGAKQALKSLLRRKEWPKQCAAWLERHRPQPRKAAAASVELPRFAGSQNLQYPLLAGCDVDQLTPIVDAVFARQGASTLSAAWISQETLRISGQEPAFSLDLQASTPAQEPVGRGFVPVRQ